MVDEKIVCITNPQQYRKANCPTKKVTLPSGAIFEIKLVSARDTLRECSNLGIKSIGEINMSEKDRLEIAKKMTAEERTNLLKLNDKIIMMAIVSPKVSLEFSGDIDILCIGDLRDEDYYSLLSEIQKMRGEASIDLQSFHQQPAAVDSGQHS